MKENFLSRLRKFNPERLFLSVLHLSAATNNDGYFSALERTWSKSGLEMQDTPAKSSLSAFREKVSADFFKEIFLRELDRIQPYRQKFHGYYIYAIDGDQLDLPASNDVLALGYRGHTFFPKLETHYPKMYTAQAVDVVNGVIKDFLYSPINSEVLLARQMVKGFEKNSITLYDRFHGHYKTALAHQQANNCFVARVTTTGRIHQKIKTFVSSNQRQAWVNLDPPRVERQTSGSTLSAIRVRLVKIKNPRTNEILVFMTNLPTATFSANKIGKLYQRRWEIEGNFRDLTSTLKMNQWHSLKLNGILQEIYALLWLVNAVRFQCIRMLVRTATWLENEYIKSNFKLAAQLVIDNLDLLIKGRTRKIMKIIKFWIMRTRERRFHLSRSYPRQVRHHGKGYSIASSIPRRPAA